MFIAELLVNNAMIYGAAGLVFAVVFAASGAGRIDPAAKGAPVGFRLLIIPGAAALWPVLLSRWIRGAHPPIERNAHRNAAKEMSI
jgi:hypothetical protein